MTGAIYRGAGELLIPFLLDEKPTVVTGRRAIRTFFGAPGDSAKSGFAALHKHFLSARFLRFWGIRLPSVRKPDFQFSPNQLGQSDFRWFFPFWISDRKLLH
jgi:hypothetical protein